MGSRYLPPVVMQIWATTKTKLSIIKKKTCSFIIIIENRCFYDSIWPGDEDDDHHQSGCHSVSGQGNCSGAMNEEKNTTGSLMDFYASKKRSQPKVSHINENEANPND